MTLQSLVFMVLCSLPVRILCQEPHHSVVPTLCMKKEWDNFVEDKLVSFSCNVNNTKKDIDITWMLRDPTTLQKVFLKLDGTDEIKGSTAGKPGQVVLPLTMRRDFSNMEVVCKTSTGGEASYALPNIRTIAPVEVTLGPADIIDGQNFQFWCDVNTKFEIESVLFFFERRSHKPTSSKTIQIASGTRSSEAGDSISKSCDKLSFNDKFHCSNSRVELCKQAQRYFFNASNAWPKKETDLRLQCLVRPKDKATFIRSRLGNIIIHYFDILNSTLKNQTIEWGKMVNLSLEIHANPRPLPEDIRVVRVKDGFGSEISEPVNGTESFLTPRDGNQYRVDTTFFAQFPGDYHMEFRTKALTKATKVFNLNMIYLKFLTGILTQRILRGETVRLNITFAAHPPPVIDDISVITWINGDKINLASTVSKKTLTRIRKDIYNAEIRFTPDHVGYYAVDFQNPNLTQTLPFQVKYHAREGTTKRKVEILLPILFVLLACYTLVFMILIVPRCLSALTFRKKNMKEWIHRRMKREPVDPRQRGMTVGSMQAFEMGDVEKEVASLSLSKTFPIIVQIPNREPMKFEMSSDDAIQDILDQSMKGHPKFQVQGVKVHGSLVDKQDDYWKLSSLEDCKITAGDEIVIHPQFPRKFRVSAFKPNSDQMFKGRTYPPEADILRESQWDWRKMMAFNSRIFKPDTLAFQWGMDYNASDRKLVAWECFNENTFTTCFCDESSGGEIPLDRAKHLVFSVLAPESGLHCPLDSIPCVEAYYDNDFLRVSKGGNITKFQNFWPIFGSQWVALLRGIHCTRPGKQEMFYGLNDGYCFVSGENGKIFPNETAVAKSKITIESVYWRRFMLLMRENDLLPAVKLPKDKTLAVFRREGLHLEVEDDRLKQPGGLVDGRQSLWKLYTKKRKFDVDFSKGTRRRYHKIQETIQFG